MNRNARVLRAATDAELAAPGYPGLTGTVTGGTASTANLNGASEIDDQYNTAYIKLTAALDGVEQVRVITDYAAGTVTITPDWDTNPVDGDKYTIYGVCGQAQGGGSSTITLSADESNTAGIYVGAFIKLNAGTGVGQVARITAYTAGRVATVTPVWEVGSEPDDTTFYSVYGEGGSATMRTAITMTAPSLLLSAASYTNMYVDILTCPSNRRAIGQVERIAQVNGTVITLAGKWPQQPIGTFTYRIIPGWSSGYELVDDATFVMSQIIGRPGETGYRETYSSITLTGANSSGEDVSHREQALWGSRLDTDTPGVASEINPVPGAYYRIDVTCFGAGLNGGVMTRFSDSSQIISAGSEQSSTSATIGGGGASGGGGGKIPALGQATMANSLPVAIANNQSVVPISAGATLEVDGAGIAGAPSGGVLSVQGVANGTVIPVTSGSDYYTEIALGNITGVSLVLIGGSTTNLTNTVGTIIIGHPVSAVNFSPVTSVNQFSLSSTSVNDNGAPANANGAQTITIEGVDTSFAAKSETGIVLDGTTTVTTTGADWYGINTAFVTAVGANVVSNAGDITIVDDLPTATKVYAFIGAGATRSKASLYYVSSTNQLHVRRMSFRAMTNAGAGTPTILIGVYSFTGGIRTRHEGILIDTTVTSTAKIVYGLPLVIPSSSVFWAQIESVTGELASISAHIDAIQY